ncbi:MAG: ABC-2 type transporter [Parcubacteria group bacterium GW2011_GWB1_40_14]|nr:MAG: ABC-2 type transporter [Parcubacteria group bacterium GW2011_GWB1_40_14]
MSHFINSIYIIWYRELLRFWRNKMRVLTGFSFPLLWLLIFGNGISASLSLPIPGVKFVQFLFPGIIAQYLIFTGMFSAISILQDREFGFLKEILVSPISRTAIALGKILGGATTSSLQVLPILFLGPLVGVNLTVKMILLLIPAIILLAIALSSIGVAITARMKSLDAGQYIFQFLAFPLVMLSGAVFPLHNLPVWLNLLTKINPISYAVDILRKIVFENSNLPPQAIESLSPTINGHVVAIHHELLIVVLFSSVMIFFASRAFHKA